MKELYGFFTLYAKLEKEFKKTYTMLKLEF